ncbi:ATP-binding cassette domain-containing protein [Hydrogenophaga sp.]|uniref:ATP-binding cassette domain-containing protein n=1 Tax=Hydrogenophaga sp. TaxID=1904254 RepID=UPI003F71F0E5
MTLSVHIQRLATRDRTLVEDVRLQVAAGQILTLMGPSGCGKSSVLAAIAGTLDTQALRFEGRVQLDGRDIGGLPTSQRGVGLLFQDDLLLAHMTVAENLLFAVAAGPKADRLAQVERALAEADLAGFGERDPATLSGGQRARVALMRALLARPRALLLDEPFSRLDAGLREQFRSFVFDHLRDMGVPAVLVTHDAADVADAALVLELAHVR